MLAKLKMLWRNSLGNNLTLKYIFTLITGTLISQAGSFILQVIAKRYFYGPAEFGQLGYVISICSIVTSIAALRYDMTIMLVDNDDQARQMYRLARRSILFFSVLTPVICVFCFPMLKAQYGSPVAQALLFGGFYVFFTAELANVQYWFNRHSGYKTIASIRVFYSVLPIALQILFALLGLNGIWGLLTGVLIGYGLSYLVLQLRAKSLHQPIAEDTPSMLWLMKRYRKMPLLGGPNVFLDAIRLNGITIVLGHESMATVGAYQTAWQALQVPISLINGAIGQVYLQKMASAKRGELYPLIRFSTFKIARWGIWPFIALFLVSPWLFQFVFGSAWAQSGDYAQALAPWLFMQLLSSPISNIFVVTERQQIMLGFSVIFAIVPLAELTMLDWTLLHRMQLLGVSMAAMLFMMIALAFRTAKIWDRESPTVH